MHDKIWSDFDKLPAEAQRQVADFIDSLKKRYHRSPTGGRRVADWESEPFVGMWRDRADLEDSTAWVRSTRQREWSEPRG